MFKKKAEMAIDAKIIFEEKKARYANYKIALDNIKDYIIHCDFQESIELMNYLGTENYEFTAKTEHDIRRHPSPIDKFIEIKKKEAN